MIRLTFRSVALAAGLTLAGFAGSAQAEATADQPRPEGNAALGKRLYGQCQACHTINEGGPHRVGPNLWGVIGRTAGTAEGYNGYSAAMKKKGEEGLVWNEDTLTEYLANPRGVVPGTNMSFVGLRNPMHVASMIAYLKENGPAE